ncbi:L-type lectin-domain containing protein [Bacillus dakarensis]|uniref:L-type lectin-domain containing protein n=1 Tax=Robertmurraya dakarensis TaxID=1926278 RepID=UPI000980978C|nr:L-type lectin-domain containing protein [Bacillus dakarensis]
MKVKKLLALLLLILCIYSFPTEGQANGEEFKWSAKVGVDSFKTWNIKFNTTVDEDSINAGAIYVEDENGNKVSTQLVYSGNEVKVLPPQKGYEKGQSYLLHIDQSIESLSSNQLKQGVNMPFIVERDPIEIYEFEDEVKEIASQELNMTENGSVEFQGNQDVQVGDIVVSPTDENNPFGVAKKITTLSQDGKTASTTDVEFTEVFKELNIYKSINLKEENLEAASLPENISVRKVNMKELAPNSDFLDTFTIANYRDYTIGDVLEFKLDALKLEVDGLYVKVDGVVRMFYPNAIVDIDYGLMKGLKRFNIKAEYQTSSKVTVTIIGGDLKKDVTPEQLKKLAMRTLDFDLPLGKFIIPINPALFLELNVQLNAEAKVNAEIGTTFELETEGELGVAIIDGDLDVIHDPKKFTPSSALHGSGTIRAELGPEASFMLKALGGAIGGGFGGEGGVYADGTLFVAAARVIEDGETAATDGCIRMELGAYLEANAQIHIALQDPIKITLAKKVFPYKPGSYNNCDVLKAITISTDSQGTSPILEPGDSEQLLVIAEINDMFESTSMFKDVTDPHSLSDKEVITYLSSHPEIVTISKDGKISVPRDLPRGGDSLEVTIEANYSRQDEREDAENKTEKLTIEVKNLNLAALGYESNPGQDHKSIIVDASIDPTTSGWIPTNLHVTKDAVIQIKATGAGNYASFTNPRNPDGFELINNEISEQFKMDDGAVLPTARIGTLIGIIETDDGQISEPFALGSDVSILAPISGELKLAYNDTPNGYYDNSGEYEVRVALNEQGPTADLPIPIEDFEVTGDATFYQDTNEFVLTEANNWKLGTVWYEKPLTLPFTASFSYLSGGGSGADGLVFMFLKERSAGSSGGYLGFNGGKGYGIEFDSYSNFADPSANHIALIKDHTENHLEFANTPITEDNAWHDVKVEATKSGITVYVDGEVVLTHEVEVEFDETFTNAGFSASTGTYNNRHVIKNISFTTGE